MRIPWHLLVARLVVPCRAAARVAVIPRTMSRVRVSNRDALGSPCCEQSCVSRRRDEFGVVHRDSSGAVGRFVPAKTVNDSQPGSLEHELAVEFDHIDDRPEVVENRPAVGGLLHGDAAHPLGHGERSYRLDVGQSRHRDAVGAVPEFAACFRRRLVDQKAYQRRCIDVDDHRRCLSTRSLTMPAVLIGAGRTPLRRLAGVTFPSAISCSSFVGTPTGMIRATGRPWSVTVMVCPSRTVARCRLRPSRNSRTPTSTMRPLFCVVTTSRSNVATLTDTATQFNALPDGRPWLDVGRGQLRPSLVRSRTGSSVVIPGWYDGGMSVQMTIRVDDDLAAFIDQAAQAGEGSRADVINRAIRREIRRRAAEQDAQIYAAGADPDLESDAYAVWAARNAGQVWSELD